MLVSFDAGNWPRRPNLRQADRYRPESSVACTGVYFSLHPRFAATGLISLATALDGMRVVRIDEDGLFTEMAAFQPAVGDVWHSYWLDVEIIYVPNRTGEIYILRYEP